MNFYSNYFIANILFLQIFFQSTLARSDILNSNEYRRDKIKEMTLHAWNSYKRDAWGKNELRPLSNTSYDDGIFGNYSIGLTIVDALDTLYLMNLTKEYEDGRTWIANEFCLDEVDQNINLFETNIRFVGGFLALYALTGDTLYRDKAKYVADKLLPAFETPTGIPLRDVNFKTGEVSGRSCLLSEFGTFSLEFFYLAHITGDSTYKEVIDRMYKFLESHKKPNNLFPTQINALGGIWETFVYSLGSIGDSFYEYLLKNWIQSGENANISKNLFLKAVPDIIKYLIKVNPDGLTYVASGSATHSSQVMEHLACFSGGMFALAAMTKVDNNQTELFMRLAKEITNTCHTLYNFTVTGLAPDTIFLQESLKFPIASFSPEYVLRPETVESYFYLYRATHDPVYREWGWEIAQAIEKNCRQPNGYAGVSNVFFENTNLIDQQHSFFLAETLKYLYLLFTEDDVLPLEQWVFNTEGHPLPILSF